MRSAKDDQSILLKKGACSSCLKLRHTSRFCKFKHKCNYLLIYPDKDKISKKENQPNAEPFSAFRISCKIDNISLVTLIVKAKAQKHERKIRAVLDTGSQNSYLSSRVIKDLNLQPQRKLKLIRVLFCWKVTEPRLHEAFDIKICNNKVTFQLK